MPTRSMSTPLALPMSVFAFNFSGDAHTICLDSDPSLTESEAVVVSKGNRPASADGPVTSYHTYHDSISTSISDSTDSSPTMSLSTMDSASTTDPSPNSSPESPESRGRGYRFSATANDVKSLPSATFTDAGAHASAIRRPRNLKNLAVNTSPGPSLGRAVSTASLPLSSDLTADPTPPVPPSATFVRPPPPSRRKLSTIGLTIMTPVTNGPNVLITQPAIPPTPSVKRPTALRHFQSSPSLSVQSPRVAPPAFQQFSSFQDLAEVPAERDEDEPNYDVPLSREEKPEAYPNGPVCIYGDNVYLYLEPTAEQAANYDVILNVASEVQNPFGMVTLNAKGSQDNLTTRVPLTTSISEPASALLPDTLDRFERILPLSNTVLEDATAAPSPSDKPALPSSAAGANRKNPEYIHIPWEHNTDIVPDLYKLVKLIDDRVSQQKRVLVHCQCGVSRSASLLVAYGLYKNPSMSVQAAYDIVKKRSKWIGPNMNLIMQLQEFRNELLRGAVNPVSRQKPNIYPRRLPHSATSTPISTSSPDRYSTYRARKHNPSSTPLSAPLPPDLNAPAQRASTGCLDTIAPGPSSAPLSYAWLSDQRNSWAPGQGSADFDVPSLTEGQRSSNVRGSVLSRSKSAHKQTAVPSLSPRSFVDSNPPQPRVAAHAASPPNSLSITNPGSPVDRKKEDNTGSRLTSSNALASPRSTEFAMTSLIQATTNDPFGLTSPHAAEFSLYPADRASQEALSSFHTQAKEAYLQLQHSPPQRFQSFELPLQQPASTCQNFSRPRPLPLEQLALPHLGPAPPKSQPDENGIFDTMRSPLLSEFALDHVDTNPPMHGNVSQSSDTSTDAEAKMASLDALTSPRAIEFTDNPFREPSASSDERMSDAPKSHDEDPRSPPLKGGSPIVRNIFEVL